MKKFNGLKKGLVYALVTAMVASCAVGIGPLRASAATTGKVNADALNVRSGAGTGYSRVGTVTQGETVTILETVQGDDGYTWYKISGSVSGYVRGDYITDIISDTTRRPSSSSGVITADWLNVRTGPGTNYSRMGSVAQGTRLTVISVHGEWYKITCQMDGEIKTGYVHSDYVQLDGAGIKLTAVGAKPFCFNASHYTQEELTEKEHNYELHPCDSTVLCLDYAQNGIGSASCGPRLAEQYRLDDASFDFSIRLIPEKA